MYATFFKFPLFHFEFDLSTAIITGTLSVVAALLGTLSSLRVASRLPPAEAMRPAPPGHYSKSWFEHFGLQKVLPQTWPMILRQLQRQPLKAVFSTMGIASAVGVLVLGSFSTDAFEFLIDFQFRQAQHQDLWVNLIEPTSKWMTDFSKATASSCIPAIAWRREPSCSNVDRDASRFIAMSQGT